MVEVKNLTKFYGSIKAVDDISFTVETGEVLGFLGPNGAGKSTTMNMITGYLSSTSGTVTIDGCEILDEPTVGLDPKQIIEIRKLIRNLGKKHTVIFSSHVLSEVSEVCDRIVVISKGKIVADAKTDELSAQVSGGQKLSLTAEGSTADITEAIKKIPAVKRVTKTGSNADGSGKYMIEYETSSDIRRDVYNAMVRVGAVILDMQSGNETLEDMFLKLTSGKYDSRKEDM